ncbi:MAG: hypothetical protein KGJ66_11745 [Alphaproteobacteria bacterium]|nr:hypothetical protein [Alphaproteobacteria bacterium]
MSATLRLPTADARSRPLLTAELVDGTEPGSNAIVPDRVIRVWLFGILSRFTTERPLILHLPATATFGEAIDTLAHRLGGQFAELVLQEPRKTFSHCRIFADGKHVENLNEAFERTTSASNIEMILVMAAEGG